MIKILTPYPQYYNFKLKISSLTALKTWMAVYCPLLGTRQNTLLVCGLMAAVCCLGDAALQLLEDPVELISNSREQRAFERMEGQTRLIGYFKGEESEREYSIT